MVTFFQSLLGGKLGSLLNGKSVLFILFLLFLTLNSADLVHKDIEREPGKVRTCLVIEPRFSEETESWLDVKTFCFGNEKPFNLSPDHNTGISGWENYDKMMEDIENGESLYDSPTKQ